MFKENIVEKLSQLNFYNQLSPSSVTIRHYIIYSLGFKQMSGIVYLYHVTKYSKVALNKFWVMNYLDVVSNHIVGI
jgi:hypothetical protein